MPIYEFQCMRCGHCFEELVPAGTEHPECPACGSEEAARRFSVPAAARAVTMSPGQARRAEQARGIDRGGALERFRRQRARGRRAGGRHG